MSGLEVVAAVSAVISAFHGGSELVKHIKKKRKSKKEQAYREKALQESLHNGETQVHQRYEADCREIGPRFRTGDAIARDRLLHIAVVLQAEIIRSLQIAIQYDNAILNLTMLNETSIMNRRDTIMALDELKQRIYMSVPIEQPLRPPEIDMQRRPSIDSVRTFMTAQPMASDYVPPAVTITEPAEEHTNGLGKLLSVARRPTSKRQGHNAGVELLPNFDWLSGHISSRDGSFDLVPEFNALNITMSNSNATSRYPHVASNDVSAASNNPNFVASNDHRHDSVLRQDSNSVKSAHSYSGSNRTSSVPSIGPHEMPAYNNSPQMDQYYHNTMSPITPDSPFQGFHPGYERSKSMFNPRNGSYSAPPEREPRLSLKTDTIMMPSNAQSMLGRPSKSNNYWGFCKGAWNCREEFKKGIALATQPSGMYGSIQVWRCRSCSFEGKAFGKKPIIIDPNVHTSGCGIKYKWSFLAKSHVKKNGHSADGDTYNYGCVFCSVANRGTPIFGNAETLMNHIYMEHSADMTKDTQDLTRCVFGREADPNEGFDINIPFRLPAKEGG